MKKSKTNSKKMTAQTKKEQLVFDDAFFSAMKTSLMGYDQFLGTKGITVDYDRLVLNEMIRQLMNSSALEGKPVDVIISDPKMSDMLNDWFDGKI